MWAESCHPRLLSLLHSHMNFSVGCAGTWLTHPVTYLVRQLRRIIHQQLLRDHRRRSTDVADVTLVLNFGCSVTTTQARHRSAQLHVPTPADGSCCCAAASTPNITLALGSHHCRWKEGGVNLTSTCLVKSSLQTTSNEVLIFQNKLTAARTNAEPLLLLRSPRRRSSHHLCASAGFLDVAAGQRLGGMEQVVLRSGCTLGLPRAFPAAYRKG